MESGRQVNYSDDILKIENKDKVLTEKIKEFKKLYNEILQLQDIKNTYGCNMKILLECSSILNLKEHGNTFNSCKETCKDKESCYCYKAISSLYNDKSIKEEIGL